MGWARLLGYTLLVIALAFSLRNMARDTLVTANIETMMVVVIDIECTVHRSSSHLHVQ